MKKALSLFDLTNLTVGSIVGADIYIASAITAGLVGPFALAVWVVAGGMATILALVFAYCSHHVPKVGGPFAYVTEAFNPFLGFLAGWCIWVAELIALPVFAIAFTNYLHYLHPLTSLQDVLVKALFLLTLTAINIVGVKAAGVVNDVLTLLKLAPLFLLVAMGVVFLGIHPEVLGQNYLPFIPLGLDRFPTAVVLVFWAYVGFELTTIPADEVKDPARTIPRAIVLGMAVVMLFYLSTNFIVYGVVHWSELAKTQVPLVLAASAVIGTAGAMIVSVGALVSVSGSDESDMLASSRLSYAMAVDGLLPKTFAALHPKFGTPYKALVIQGVAAFGLSLASGLAKLISFSVFNLSVGFLLVCLALLVFQRRSPRVSVVQGVMAGLGLGVCLFLIYSTSVFDKIVGTLVLAAGAALYWFYSPKQEISHLKALWLTEAGSVARLLERERRSLGGFFRLVYRWMRWSRRV